MFPALPQRAKNLKVMVDSPVRANTVADVETSSKCALLTLFCTVFILAYASKVCVEYAFSRAFLTSCSKVYLPCLQIYITIFVARLSNALRLEVPPTFLAMKSTLPLKIKGKTAIFALRQVEIRFPNQMFSGGFLRTGEANV